MQRQSQRGPRPFYESSSGQVRILTEGLTTISEDNRRRLDDAVREMPNQRLKLEIRSQCIDDDALDAFRQAILVNERLQWIQLSEAEFTSDGLKQLCQCLEKTTCLQVLVLRNAKLTDAALPTLIGMLERSNTPYVAMQRLQLPCCSFSEKKWIQLFRSFTDNTTCTNFQFLNSKLTDEVVDNFSELLRDNKTLRQIRLQGLNDTSAVRLCQALRKKSTFKNISLGYGPPLSIDAISSLCAMLVSNTSLRILSIEDSKRKVTTGAMQQLFEALQSNTKMTNIRIGGSLADDTILELGKMLKLNKTCTNIGMKTDCTPGRLAQVWKALATDNKIERLNFQNTILKDSTVPTLCQFINSNSSVETFDFGQSRFTAEGLGKVLCTLLQNANWQNFELGGAMVGDESVDHLCQLIKTNNTLCTLVINRSEVNATKLEKLCEMFCENATMKAFWVDMNFLRRDCLDYVSSLLGTSLESFVAEEVITDAEFNLIFGIVKDNPCIVEVRIDPFGHQMIFKYRGIDGVPPRQYQVRPSTD